MRSSLQATCAIALLLGSLVGCGTAPAPLTPGSQRAVGQFHAHGGSAYSLVVMPDQGVAPILNAIQGAKRTIQLEMYMFTDHDQTAQLVQALCDRAKAGVDVRVMLDPKPYTGNSGGPSPNIPAAQALKAGGVKVQDTAPRFKYTHEKSMVIDGTTALIMTCNFTNSAFTTNREYAVFDQNPEDVAEVAGIFQADWNHSPYAPQDANLVVSPDNSRKRLLALIDSAQKTLIMQDEEIGDPEINAHLGARAKAGVNVRVMLSNLATLVPTEEKALAAAGVTQVEVMTSLTLHAKTIVVDGARAYVGSENMSTNSLDHNREMGVILQDPAAVATLVAITNKDWASK